MKVHFTSIGGSVMHQLAIALKNKGYQVTGSDDEIFEPSKTNLEHHGLLPRSFGWEPNNITVDLDAVVLGMHARADNPELLRAKDLGLDIYSFPEYIYKESKEKKRIVVGGSHGKTSTTAMIMHVLNYAEKNFDYLVGAKIKGFEQSVSLTDAPLIVCEGDEYPASALERKPKFHFLFPHIAILTGIAWDHINVFPTFENYLQQFTIFIGKIEPQGVLIYNETDAELNKLVEATRRSDIQYLPYGVPSHTINDGKTFVTFNNLTAAIKVFGDHNLLNMHAAFYACMQAGVDAATFVEAIQSFEGASRRLELLASNKNTNIYRDFAHAPSKVSATIQAVKQQFTGRRLVAVLELHTYSSLNPAFMQEYNGAMQYADVAIVFYSSHALEIKKMPPLPKSAVEQGFAKSGLVVMNDRTELEAWLNKVDLDNSNLLLMSSGNYDGLDIIKFATNKAATL